MAFEFVAGANFDTAGATEQTCDKPAGTAENDVMIAIHAYYQSATESGPAGWTELAAHANGNYKQKLYYKKAGAGEAATYTWTLANSYRGCVSIATYRGDIDLADIIESVSNTEYVVNDKTAQAASINSAVSKNHIVFAAVNDNVNTTGWTKPTTPVDSWVEDIDADTGANFCRTICHLAGWTGSGATGAINGVFADAANRTTSKHAFAVILNHIYVKVQALTATLMAEDIVDVDFDGVITQASAENEANWTITKVGGGAVPAFTCVRQVDTSVVRVTFDTPLAGSYSLDASGVLDTDGVAVDPAHDTVTVDALPPGGGKRKAAWVF